MLIDRCSIARIRKRLAYGWDIPRTVREIAMEKQRARQASVERRRRLAGPQGEGRQNAIIPAHHERQTSGRSDQSASSVAEDSLWHDPELEEKL